MMELLGFDMPPFARIQYVTAGVKNEWEPRVARAAKAYYDLELLTVKHGVRACTTRHVSPQNLEYDLQNFARHGLVWLPIQRVGSYQGFAHKHPPVQEGRPWAWYGVVARTMEDALKFVEASTTKFDHDVLGQLLGYPDCCRKFFNEVWGAGYIDPIWQQAGGDLEHMIQHEVTEGQEMVHFSSSVSHLTVSMLRYIGVRIVPHIPCSVGCKHSEHIAQAWFEVGEKEEVEGLRDLVALLTLPTEWDCLRGIAVVSTPLFKIQTNSMTTTKRYIVRKDGEWYPEEAPSGLKFPWQTKVGFGCNTSIRSHAKSDLIQVESTQ